MIALLAANLAGNLFRIEQLATVTTGVRPSEEKKKKGWPDAF